MKLDGIRFKKGNKDQMVNKTSEWRKNMNK